MPRQVISPDERLFALIALKGLFGGDGMFGESMLLQSRRVDVLLATILAGNGRKRVEGGRVKARMSGQVALLGEGLRT